MTSGMKIHYLIVLVVENVKCLLNSPVMRKHPGFFLPNLENEEFPLRAYIFKR